MEFHSFMQAKRSRWRVGRILIIVATFRRVRSRLKDERQSSSRCLNGHARGFDLRREHAALRSGRLIDLFFDEEAYVFARQLEQETIVVAINRENKAKQVSYSCGFDRFEGWDDAEGVDRRCHCSCGEWESCAQSGPAECDSSG